MTAAITWRLGVQSVRREKPKRVQHDVLPLLQQPMYGVPRMYVLETFSYDSQNNCRNRNDRHKVLSGRGERKGGALAMLYPPASTLLLTPFNSTSYSPALNRTCFFEQGGKVVICYGSLWSNIVPTVRGRFTTISRELDIIGFRKNTYIYPYLIVRGNSPSYQYSRLRQPTN